MKMGPLNSRTLKRASGWLLWSDIRSLPSRLLFRGRTAISSRPARTGPLICWQAETGKPIWTGESYGPVAFTPDGANLVAGDWENGIISIHDPKTGQQPRQFPTGGKGLWSISISPDGQAVAIAGELQ